MKNGTSFTTKVYQITDRIPFGKVATYAQIANLAGSPNAVRAVGTLMKNNPNAPKTPCHRVVASDGALTGYSAPGGLAKKLEMLKKEGVKFLTNGKVDLTKSLWNGKI